MSPVNRSGQIIHTLDPEKVKAAINEIVGRIEFAYEEAVAEEKKLQAAYEEALEIDPEADEVAGIKLKLDKCKDHLVEKDAAISIERSLYSTVKVIEKNGYREGAPARQKAFVLVYGDETSHLQNDGRETFHTLEAAEDYFYKGGR